MARALVVVVGLALLPRAAHAQGYAPEQAAARMTVAPGLKARLFASEPLVRQPVAIEFDDRGRMWVIQYLQYPNPAGLRRVTVDRYSRTQYDRVPEPPPHGPKGADRITILEDRDGDGRADHAHDFLTGLNLASGLAFGYGGVFVAQAPYLLFYADKNRDDVPDGDPEVLLEGFGLDDAHSVLNSLTWGPDGWLYGLQGSTVTARVRGVEFQQGVWRYHPPTRRFELFSEGGGNMWGLDFDRHGNLFACTNVGGFVMLHAVQGGYYWKAFGKHGPLHNPYTFGYFDHVPHAGVRGGHVAVGGLFYEAAAFPSAYRGKFLAGDLLDHSAHWHAVERSGSTFRATQQGDLLRANDTWFAPTDMTLGPDGSVYITDWHDRRTAHPDPDADWDRSNGRVFALDGPGGPRAARVEMTDLSSDKLVALLDHPNVWYVRRARRLLAERGDRSVWPALRDRARNGRGSAALEAFWALHGAGGFDDELAGLLLLHADEDVRAWTVRLLADRPDVSPAMRLALVALAATEASVVVRAQLASSARRLPHDAAHAIVERILRRDLDGHDPFLPLLLWWAVERDALAPDGRGLEPYITASAWRSGLVRAAIAPRLMMRCAAERNALGDAYCARILATAPPEAEAGLLAALDEATRGRRGRAAAFAGPLAQAVANRFDADPDSPALLRIAARLGHAPARQRALERAADAQAPEVSRLVAIALLGELGEPDSWPVLLALATGEGPAGVQAEALRALAPSESPAVPETILAAYPRKPAAWQARARDVLLGRATSAARFLRAVDCGAIAAADVPLDQVRRVALLGDETLNAAVRRLWGTVAAATPEEKLAEVRRLNNDLRAAAGDPARGHALFLKHCATCHRLFGEGQTIGPDLTHANRSDRDYLLVSLLDPGAVVRKEYQAFVVAMRDGRVLTGLIAEQSPESLTLIDANAQRTALPRAEVESLKESTASLMPEGLYRQLKPDELRDLFRYLQGPGPGPGEGSR